MHFQSQHRLACREDGWGGWLGIKLFRWQSSTLSRRRSARQAQWFWFEGADGYSYCPCALPCSTCNFGPKLGNLDWTKETYYLHPSSWVYQVRAANITFTIAKEYQECSFATYSRASLFNCWKCVCQCMLTQFVCSGIIDDSVQTFAKMEEN